MGNVGALLFSIGHSPKRTVDRLAFVFRNIFVAFPATLAAVFGSYGAARFQLAVCADVGLQREGLVGHRERDVNSRNTCPDNRAFFRLLDFHESGLDTRLFVFVSVVLSSISSVAI